jgi:hypothetical protein
MTAKPGSPMRRRKRVLLPPDPPLPGTDNIWQEHIATVRRLPAEPLDPRQPQAIWIDDSPWASLSTVAIWFNEVAHRTGFAIAIVLRVADFDIVEFQRGAVDHAEQTDRGPIGQFLRVLKQYGGFNKNDSAHDHAIGIRRSVRHNNSGIIAANERAIGETERKLPKRDLAEIVRRSERILDRLIGPLPEHRDIEVGAPKRIHPRRRFAKAGNLDPTKGESFQ